MAFDDKIENKQGSSKTSEAFTDRVLEIIQNEVGETSLRTLEMIMKPMSDAIRRNNFIAHSYGQIKWTGTAIEFDADGQNNSIVLKLLLMDEGAPRTVDIWMQGSSTANSPTEFFNIPMNNNDLLYLEIDRDLLLSAVSPSPGVEPAKLVIGNNASDVNIVAGARLQKVSLSDTNGMPEMLSTESGTTKSQTMNIPLATRIDWTDGLETFSDIWWIPHGIRWPENTISAIGAVVVKGTETLPSLYVKSFDAVDGIIDAINFLTPTGGIILLAEQFTLIGNITIPKGITLMARSNMQDGADNADPTLFVASGAGIILEDGAKMWNINVESLSNFGSSFEESLVRMTGDNAEVRDCSFRLDPTAGASSAVAVKVEGSRNRIWNTKFRIQNTGSHIGISYFSGTSNVDTDSIFDHS